MGDTEEEGMTGPRHRALAVLIDQEFCEGKLDLVPRVLGWRDHEFMSRRMQVDYGRCFDHVWKLYSRRERRPVGMVSEPYMSQDDAARLAPECFSPDDGFVVCVLPKAQSAWFPGSCVVIVVLGDIPAARRRWGRRQW